MTSIAPNMAINYATDLMRHFPRRQVDGDGLEPLLATHADGRVGVRLALADNAATNSRSAMRYSVRHLRAGDGSSLGTGAQNTGVIDAEIEFEYESTAGLFGSARDRVFAFYQSGDTAFLNVAFATATTVRVFLSGVSQFVATIPGGINVATGTHTIRVHYARSGLAGVAPTVRVWVDGQELTLSAGLASHSQTYTCSTYDFSMRADSAGVGGGNAPSRLVFKHRLRIGAGVDPGDHDGLEIFDEGGVPPGLAHWCDVVRDEAVLAVSEFPGRLGYDEVWSTVLYAVGSVWPGDENADATAPMAHTQASLWLAHHPIAFTPPDPESGDVLMAKVVIQDAESAPANTWTSGVYTVKPLGTADDAATLARGVDLWALYCCKGFGRGSPDFLDVIAADADDSRDTVALWIEDEVYSDDREPNEDDALSFPQGALAVPDYQGAHPSGSGLDIATAVRMLWEGLPFSAFHARFAAWRVGPCDHTFDNGYRAETWAGSATVVGGKWGSLTRGEIHNRGNDFLARAFKPGILGAPAQGADPHPPLYSAKRVGPLLIVGLDTVRYAVDSGAYLGAAQLAWLRNLLQTTDAKHVLICSPTSMFDAVYKTGQDWQAFASWRAERTLILDDIEGNASIESAIVTVGDSHLAWWYPLPSATHPKLLGEFAAGALSSTMLAVQTFVPDIATVVSRVTAGGRPGWVGPHSGSAGSDTGGEIGDGKHQRRTGRLRYDVDGSLTLEMFSADFDPDDPPSALPAPLRTVSLTAFALGGSLTAAVNGEAAASGAVIDLGEVELGAIEVATIQLTAGGGDVAIGSVIVTGQGSIGAFDPTNTTIPEGDDATLTVNVSTATLGGKAVNVTIPSDDDASPFTLTLNAEVTGIGSLEAILTTSQAALAAANAAQVAANAANAAAQEATAAVAALNARVGGLLEPAPSGSGADERFRPAVVANAPAGEGGGAVVFAEAGRGTPS